jgi:alkanesulfonate monooxygenase SsuD/methylene tetrahydromethanopterin reductase-like flavin-dependent oxidoreductase (luciferase family)
MSTDRPLAVGLPPMETRRDVVLHVAARAEELGYAAFFLAEGWGHDASVLLTEIAVRTSRIRIGTGVVNVWGRSAASIAMLATSLGEVSGGRFVLGLGAGSPQLAEGLHDVAFRAPVERLAETTRQVRGSWTVSGFYPRRPGAAGRCGWRCGTRPASPSSWPRWARRPCVSPANWPTPGIPSCCRCRG